MESLICHVWIIFLIKSYAFLQNIGKPKTRVCQLEMYRDSYKEKTLFFFHELKVRLVINPISSPLAHMESAWSNV